MAKATLPFGEWRPDLSLLDNQFASIADNVFSATNCYKPIPSLLPFSNAMLPASAVGLAPVRRLDGTWDIYAGTRTNLYKWAYAGWIDVSRTTGGAYNVPPLGELWSFAQYGTHLIAVNVGDVPQWIDVEAGTNFVALPGTPPRAHNVKQIGDFVVLGGLIEGATLPGTTVATNRRQIIWCGINDPTNWTVGTNLCDFQEFPDGGPVQGIAGNEIGYVLQDRSVRLMQYLPADTSFIFNFSRVVKDKGSISEFGFSTVADDLYFMAEDGPYQLSGNQLNPIGQDKVSEWFLANSNVSYRNVVQVIPTNRPYVVFAFYSTPQRNSYDRVLIYNWLLQRWTTGTIYAQVWALLGSHSLDLDTTGPEPGDAYLDSGPGWAPPPSGAGTPWPAGSPAPLPLDSFAYRGGRPLVCAIDAQGRLCALNGPNLQATVGTAEAHLVPGMRAFVSEVYPLGDTASGTVSVEMRERLGDAPSTTLEFPIEITGSASVLTSARLQRFTFSIPAGDAWTTTEGLLVEAQPDGQA